MVKAVLDRVVGLDRQNKVLDVRQYIGDWIQLE